MLRHTFYLIMLAGCFFANSASASCDSLSFRNYSLPRVKAGEFNSRNGEFSVRLPFPEQRLEFGSFGNKCFYAINVNSLVSTDHRSIEWVELDKSQSKEDFLAYWNDFIPDYLAKNFGSGGYKLVKMVEYTTATGRPGLRYVGTGTNNGGGEGAIYGVVMQFGERMANVYAITSPVKDEDHVLDSEVAESVRKMAESVTCSISACNSP